MRWILMAAIFLSGCAANITYDYDREADFATRNTFSFLQEEDKKRAQALDERRIRTALQRELTAKGMRDTDPNDANMLVAYRIEDAKRLQSSGISYGIGFGGRHSLFGINTAPEAREINEGRVVVEIIDPRRNDVIWRATSRSTLTPTMEADERTQMINELVREMMANYPPLTTG